MYAGVELPRGVFSSGMATANYHGSSRSTKAGLVLIGPRSHAQTKRPMLSAGSA